MLSPSIRASRRDWTLVFDRASEAEVSFVGCQRSRCVGLQLLLQQLLLQQLLLPEVTFFGWQLYRCVGITVAFEAGVGVSLAASKRASNDDLIGSWQRRRCVGVSIAASKQASNHDPALAYFWQSKCTKGGDGGLETPPL